MADNHIWHFKADGTITNHVNSVNFNDIARYLDGQFLDVDGNVINIANNDIIADNVDSVGGVPADKFYKITDNIIDEINSTPTPILECLSVMTESKTYDVTILNYDVNTAYTITFGGGTYSNIDETGRFTVTVDMLPDQIDMLETSLVVYGEQEGLFRSPDARIEITIEKLPVTVDQSVLDDDFSAYIVDSTGIVNNGTSLFSENDNACAVETKVIQDADEGDWVSATGSVIKYDLKEIMELDLDESTTSVLVSGDSLDRTLVKNDKIVAIDSANNIKLLSIDGYILNSSVELAEVNQLTASDAEDSDYFGYSVALSGDGLIAMVSAYGEDTAGTDTGKVYTYKRDTIDDAWTEVSQLTASDAEDSDHFGTGVALSSDGLIAMVGAINEDTAVNNAGKVYTYKRDTVDDAWTEVNQLTASDAEDSDSFGTSVALSSDGLIAIVGARSEDTAGTDTGKVYTYKRDTIDDTWTEVNQLTASDAEDYDYFGNSVALSSDGLIAMVGTYLEDTAGDNAGKVYTYKRDTIDDAWTEVSQLTASDAADTDYFGYSVALSSDGLVAMVGANIEDTAGDNAGKVYTYKRDTIDDTWTEVNQLTASDAEDYDYYGSSVALSGDGLIAMVGAYGEDSVGNNAGKVYTYNISYGSTSIDVTSSELTEIPSKIYYNDNVNLSLLLENDINVKHLGCNTYLDIMQTTDETGATITLKDKTLNENSLVSIDGVLAPVGTRDFDNAWLTNVGYDDSEKMYYTKDSATTTTFKIAENIDTLNSGDVIVLDETIFTEIIDVADVNTFGIDVVEINQLTASDAEDYDQFGTSVALSDDGLIAIVGAVGEDSSASAAGKVYTYKRDTIDDLWTEVNQLTASDAEDTDYYGGGVALSGDGLIAMVGAYLEDTAVNAAGKVYTYKRDTIDDAWTEVSQLTASDAEDTDYFGWSVALSGDGLIAMVGAYLEDTAASNTGKVYTYKRDTIDDTWTEVSQLTASDAEDTDYFGYSVALSSDGIMAMVGAIGEDSAGDGAGKVYTYKRDTTDDTWTEVNQLTASDAEDSDYYGSSVALSGDGLIAMVGAYGEDTAGTDAGKVYTYKRDTIDDAWTEVSQLTASDAEDYDYFGISVALSGDGFIAIVGAYYEDSAGTTAGKVYTYKLGEVYTEVSFTEQSVEPTTMFKPLSYVPYLYQIPSHILTKKPTVAYLPHKVDLELTSTTTTNIVGKVYDATNDLLVIGDKIFADNKETVITDISYTDNDDGSVTFDITVDALVTAPSEVSIVDKTKTLLSTSTTFDGTVFTDTLQDLESTGRELIRKVSMSNTDTTLYTPIVTELNKLG